MIDSLYLHAYNSAGNDIRDNMPMLKQYASMCNHVTEFGTRGGNSSAALLAGMPSRLVCYDVLPCLEAVNALNHAAQFKRVSFQFRQKSSLEADIEITDMLFIDTIHTAVQVYAELTRHAHKVRKFLAFHDTTTCGEVDGYYHEKPLGLLYGIGRYMWEHADKWLLVYKTDASNGLMVFARIEDTL